MDAEFYSLIFAVLLSWHFAEDKSIAGSLRGRNATNPLKFSCLAGLAGRPNDAKFNRSGDLWGMSSLEIGGLVT